MRGHVELARCLECRQSLLLEGLDLIPEVEQVLLISGDALLGFGPRKGSAVARNDDVEVERLQDPEGLNVVDRIEIAGITAARRARLEEVTRSNDAFLGKEDQQVTSGVAAPGKDNLNFASAAMQDQVVLHDQC